MFAQAAYLREIRFNPFKNTRYFRVNILAQKRGVHTRIGGHVLLVKRLNQGEGLISAKAIFLIALYLQRSEVEKPRRKLCAFLFLYFGNAKRLILQAFKQSLSSFSRWDRVDADIRLLELLERGHNNIFTFLTLLLLGFLLLLNLLKQIVIALTNDGVEKSIAVGCFEFPIGAWHEMVNLALAVYDKGESRRLHTSDAERLLSLALLLIA